MGLFAHPLICKYLDKDGILKSEHFPERVLFDFAYRTGWGFNTYADRHWRKGRGRYAALWTEFTFFAPTTPKREDFFSFIMKSGRVGLWCITKVERWGDLSNRDGYKVTAFCTCTLPLKWWLENRR